MAKQYSRIWVPDEKGHFYATVQRYDKERMSRTQDVNFIDRPVVVMEVSEYDRLKKHELKNTDPISDWEYLLKSCIYTTLIGFNDSNGHSIPCKEREQMELSILKKFKDKFFQDAKGEAEQLQNERLPK